MVNLGDIAILSNDSVDVNVFDFDNYISTENMIPNRGGVVFSHDKHPKIGNTGKIKSYLKNDILISNIRPYFKKIWKSDRDGTRSGDVLSIRPISNKIDINYLYVLLQSDNFFEYMMTTSKGTKMPRGDKKAILSYPIKLVNINEQKKIGNQILMLEKKMEMNKKINDNLFCCSLN
ncbi:restriction endonuclease subunit S [Companilactobacillus furfuricola]|uniref:restriction endonuclease subunit S n=1 Tax=Companilactobacillus furfuricola TaxID=1462575 RepID=UPI000F7A7056|nr:restriction endonuclease subunit S [Companilactobacillus furfuricola]